MRKRSILWCVFHHPVKIIIRTVIIWIVLMLVWYLLSDDGEALMQSDLYYTGTLVVSFILGILRVQKISNNELKGQSAARTQAHFMSTPVPKKKKKSLLFGAMKSMDNAMNRELNGFANGLGKALEDSFKTNPASEAAWQESKRKGDQEARNRWYARNMQKKAEYDARDAALRGKDRAAYQRQQDADYWYNQSRR